jgi:hypothetical protein
MSKTRSPLRLHRRRVSLSQRRLPERPRKRRHVLDDVPDLQIATDKVCFIIVKARQFDEKEAITDPDSGSNPTDDGGVDVLEDGADDPVQHELISFIHDLDVDEQIELVALAWLGRGDDDLAGWSDLQTLAREQHNKRTAAYLLGMPLLADYLEEGLSLFGESCSDIRPALAGNPLHANS